MKSSKPNSIHPTFEEFDLLDRKPFAQRLESFLLTERHFVPNSLVVSLNASFGSGKSTFLEMWIADMENRQKDDETAGIPILLNAWESDYAGEPVMALLDSINTLLVKHSGEIAGQKEESALKEAVLDSANYLVAYGNSVVSSLGLGDPMEAGEKAQAKKDQRQERKKGIQPLNEFRERRHAFQVLKVALANCFKESKRPVFIFIDELDRCRPDYAVTYLETIKHLFDTEGLIFILAVDMNQLECSTRVLYGDLNFSEYFRKFCHRVVKLPEPSRQFIGQLCQRYYRDYLVASSDSSIRHSVLPSNSNYIDDITRFIEFLKLTPRQAQELFRILGHLTSTTKNTDSNLRPEIGAKAVFMAASYLGNRLWFDKIVGGPFGLKDINPLLKSLFSKEKDMGWWRKMLIAEQFDSEGVRPKIDEFLAAVVEAEVLPDVASPEQVHEELRQFFAPYRDSKFSSIGKDIIEIVGFADTWS